MAADANILVHPSQFPQNVYRDLLASLRHRRVNHKFHYDSVKQTQKWLSLHQQFSPSRRDADCRRIYNQSFAAAAGFFPARKVHLIGLGCGGGQKDTRLLKLLKKAGKEISYTPCDVSAAMVLTARREALSVLPAAKCFPAVCDLAASGDLRSFLVTRPAAAQQRRLVTFFGMIPNFDPKKILPKLVSLLRPADVLLFSANLAPGPDYDAGIKKILPQYDNPATRDWLMTFLLDLGVEPSDGRLYFEVETVRNGLKRVVADFRFTRKRVISIDANTFSFARGESVRLFYSYRYTPDRVCQTLAYYQLEVCGQWIATSEEEGVFLCRKNNSHAKTARDAKS
jgi:uncharacterized SAM-dependent methyltransferase